MFTVAIAICNDIISTISTTPTSSAGDGQHMAVTKTKRSVPLKQTARRSSRGASGPSVLLNSPQLAVKELYALSRASARKARIPTGNANRKLIHFPRLRGKVIKEIEFFVDPSHNCLLLRFQDNTSLVFDFATSFATEAHFSRWKAGNERVLHYWPRLQSDPIF